MKYILKQKLISIGDDFYILDENKNKVFEVDGKFFTVGEKLYFKDIEGNKLFTIKKKLARLTDTYHIEKNGETFVKIHKEMFTLFKDKFEIKTPYGEIVAKGSFLDYDYSFKLKGKKIGEVSKKFFSLRDSYAIDIKDFDDPALLLACTVVIDMICHDSK